jgi:hypothetical protein
VKVTLAYLNTRHLGDDWPRAEKLEDISDTLQVTPDVLMLSETKCKTKVELIDKLSFQTSLSQRGGALAIHNSS